MSIGGISGGNGFLQVNNAINQLGEQKASMMTQRGKAITDVSNFGNETKLGRSAFQQANEKVLNTGEQKTSMLSVPNADLTSSALIGVSRLCSITFGLKYTNALSACAIQPLYCGRKSAIKDENVCNSIAATSCLSA